jgi:hypothetical protein
MKGFRLAFATMAVGLLALPAVAQGSFHFVSVREVYPGDDAHPNAEYVVLQMYAAGQHLVADHELTMYGPGGFDAADETGSGTFADDLVNGQNQRTMLLATPEAETEFSITADATLAPGGSLDPDGGAVCWGTGDIDPPNPLDCVAWGSFNDPDAAKMARVGTPEAAPENSNALRRTIAPNCSTMLEAADDTNDSAADFLPVVPSPRNNSSAITETPCPPDNTVVPKVSGTPVAGRTLSCARGTWTGSPPIAYSYRWLRDGATISAQTASTYVVKAADAGHSIRCRVIATNAGGQGTATSAAVIIKTPPKNTVAPKITGTPRVGRTLSCSLGSWTGSAPISYTRQWLRNGVAIAGATGANYVAKPADAGKLLSCRVTAKNAAGQASRTSAAIRINP